MNQISRASEADKIFRAIFHRDRISKPLFERFSSASVELEKRFDPREVELCRLAIEKVKDLEALEYAARLRRRLPLFIKKFGLMIALSECEPRFRSYFVNSRDHRITAWFAIVWQTARSGWKLLKGLVLLRLLEYLSGSAS